MSWITQMMDHGARISMGLTANEYMILDHIYKTQTSPDYGGMNGGWCEIPIRTTCEFFGLSPSSVCDMLKKLSKDGFLEVDGKKRRTTAKWYRNYGGPIKAKNNSCSETEQINNSCSETLSKNSETEQHTLVLKSNKEEAANSTVSLKEKTGHGVEPQSEDGVAVSVDYTLRDEELNREIIYEVLWRLDNEYSSSELFGMFGDDCDLVSEKQFLAERWASGDKEMVKHPKSNRKRDLKYQSCLKGFKRWVESYASKRSKVPVSDRKIRTSHQQDEVDYVLLKKTAIAHGAPTFDRWWERMGRKSGQWKLDEELLMQFHKMFGTLEEKQKYLIYSLHKKPTIHPTYPDKDLNIVLKNIVRDGFMDKAVILESDGYFKEREWIGRPVSLYQYPPEYYPVKMPQCDRDSIMSMVPKGYYDACDRKYPPVYMYLDGIRLKKDNPYANIKPVDSQTYLKNDK